MNEKSGSYTRARNIFTHYWHCYGGFRALFRSPYLHIAFLGTLAFWPAWYETDWWKYPLGVLPDIVGFSIGGYAIWLGFGDDRFKALIAGPSDGRDVSPYMEISATFAHFVVVQLLAIAFAVGVPAFYFEPSWSQALAETLGTTWGAIAWYPRVLSEFVGFFLFAYALTSAVAAVFAIFEVARLFDVYRAMSAKLAARQSPPPGSTAPGQMLGTGGTSSSPSVPPTTPAATPADPRP